MYTMQNFLNKKVFQAKQQNPKTKAMLFRKIIQYNFAHHTKICIIGGGTGGVNVSAHLLRSKILPRDITLFQPGQFHYYQPGWTLVGSGLVNPVVVKEKMEKIVPDSIHLVKESVTLIKPEQNLIITNRNHEYTYDHLIISSGFHIDWDKIKGARQLLEDPHSNVCSVYDHNFAQKTHRLGEKFQGGRAIFTQPKLPFKCAGAPQKIMYLLATKWQKRQCIPTPPQFVKASPTMFIVPKYAKFMENYAKSLGIKVTFEHSLVEVTEKKAIFEHIITKQRLEKEFDFLHLVPPMSAPSFITQSGLANLAGFVDVDDFTLRHQKYPNIWSLGDSSSLPTSKTATAIFHETPALVKNLLTVLEKPKAKQLPGKYNGYTGCPLFIGGRKSILAEFLYDKKIDETFFRDQEKPRMFFYYMVKYLFPFAYWKLMPRGLWMGRDGIRFRQKL